MTRDPVSKRAWQKRYDRRPEVIDRNHLYDKIPENRYRRYKKSAEDRDIVFELSLSEFSKIVAQPCYICGLSDEPNGIDRLDNELGYTLENSRPCCKKCNIMKSTYSFYEFISHIKRIIDHRLSIP